MKREANKPGPLESYPTLAYCEMCGARDYKKQGSVVAGHAGLAGLEPAFDPSGQPKTLCRDCRIGSAELLADVRADLLAACKLALKVIPALGYEPGTAQRKAHDALVAAIAKAKH